MKITLDLTDLVGRGVISIEEAERLKKLAARETGSAGVNILLAFGIVAVVLGAGALVPAPETAIVLGGLLFALGMGLALADAAAWKLLASICLSIGALVLGGGVLILFDGALPAMVALTLGVAVAAVLARSGLLAAIAVLGLSAVLGSYGGYSHAMYTVFVPEPALSVVALSLLALVLFLLSTRVPHTYERIAIIAARTAVLLVNVAFLVGSLWGDQRLRLPDWTFSIGWAVVLIAVGAWAVAVNRRWVVNVAAVFGAIHFYTQWFEVLGANPVSLLGAGLLLVGFGLALWEFNRRLKAREDVPTAPGSGVPPAAGAPA